MTKETLAEALSGREYGGEITKDECALAKQYGLVVIFGYSDDNVELRGAIHDEIGMYEGGDVYLHAGGIVTDPSGGDCGHCGERTLAQRAKAERIKCAWGESVFAWHIEPAKIPFAPFEIMEGGEKFCRGIVISVSDLPKI